jgi:hypothetical protein
LAFFPVGVGLLGDAHPLGRFPLKEAKFLAALLEVLAEGLGVFGIIPLFLSFERQRRPSAKGHRIQPVHRRDQLEARAMDIEIDEGGNQ